MLLDWSITVVKVNQTTYYLQLWPVARLGSQTPSEPTGSFLLCRVPAQPCSPATRAQAKLQTQGQSLYVTTRFVCRQTCRSPSQVGKLSGLQQWPVSPVMETVATVPFWRLNLTTMATQDKLAAQDHAPITHPHVKVELHSLFIACTLLLCEPYCNTSLVRPLVEQYTPWDKRSN